VEGNLAEAVRWAEDSGLKADDMPSFSQRVTYTTLVRVLIAQGGWAMRTVYWLSYRIMLKLAVEKGI
jgi:hypothetical protein